jgi:putative ABC transport system permease protein
MHTLLQDLRYGLRVLAKAPGFTGVVILTLALGIGANTAIFSVVNTVLLQPLPFPEPDRLVDVFGINERTNERGRALSYPDFVDLRTQNRTLESMAAYDEGVSILSGVGEPLHLRIGIVSANLFSVLHASPTVGRLFASNEDQPGTRVVMLSHGLWKGHFGGDPNIAGRPIKLDEKIYTIAGVMPASFQFPIDAEPMDLWTTMAANMETQNGDPAMTAQRGAHFLRVVGRLKQGATLGHVNADFKSIAVSLQEQFPDTNRHFGLGAQPQIEALVGDFRPALLMVVGAVAFLLLIACANAANLLLARAAGRQREVAIRTSIGAGRSRIIRQLLTESLLLSVGGGILGLVFAEWGTKLFAHLPSVQIPRLAGAKVDLPVLGFTLVVSLLTGVLFGLAPALHSLRFDMFRYLKEGGRAVTEGISHTRLRSIFVIAEVSLAVILMAGASLLLESMLHLLRVSPGFDPEGVLTFNINLPDTRYGKSEQSGDFYLHLLERLRGLPGVKNASGVMPLPLSNAILRTTFQVETRPVAKSEEPVTNIRAIGLDYFRTMRIPILAGRDFKGGDDRQAKPVVIINQTLARTIFPNEDPIGKHIQPRISASGPSVMREIIGVVGDVKHRNLWQESSAESYVPYDQVALGQMTVVVRTAGEPMGLLSAAREQVKAMDAELPIYHVQSLAEYVAASLAQKRFTTALCGFFAAAGLLLAVIGLFGVISYNVEQRTHELGVRLAIGAEKADILRLVLSHGMRVTVVGIATGLLGALALVKVLKGQLYGVTATDPFTLLGVAFLLGVAALTACYFPARRATRVDPLVALRYE